MIGSTALEKRKTLVRFEAMMASHSASAMSSVSRMTAKPPALLTSASTRPQRASTASSAAAMSAARVTSQREGERVRPSAAQRGGHGVGARPVQVQRGHAGALARAGLRDGGADAPRRAGDDDDLPLEPHAVPPLGHR